MRFVDIDSKIQKTAASKPAAFTIDCTDDSDESDADDARDDDNDADDAETKDKISPLTSNFDGTQTLRLPLPMTTTLVATKLNLASPRVMPVVASTSQASEPLQPQLQSEPSIVVEPTAVKFELLTSSNSDFAGYIKKLEQER